MTPLILIAGFLGAGKTTLLRELIPLLGSLGLRPHVILNDYRNARIDAASLGHDRELVSPIAGSCICCGSQEELMRELEGAPLTPESVMLLEANGTADTAEIIEILTADRRVARYTLPVQITVVDVDRWQQRDWNDRLERTQVQTARYLHLTRVDEVGAERLEEVRRSVKAVSPHGRFVNPAEVADVIERLKSSVALLPPRRFSRGSHAGDSGPEGRATDLGDGDEHRALHHFSSVEIPLREPVHEGEFRNLLESLPKEILRVKGIARVIGEDHPVYFQRTDLPGSVELLPIREQGDFDFLAVLIGLGLDGAALTRAFGGLGPPMSRGPRAW